MTICLGRVFTTRLDAASELWVLALARDMVVHCFCLTSNLDILQDTVVHAATSCDAYLTTPAHHRIKLMLVKRGYTGGRQGVVLVPGVSAAYIGLRTSVSGISPLRNCLLQLPFTFGTAVCYSFRRDSRRRTLKVVQSRVIYISSAGARLAHTHPRDVPYTAADYAPRVHDCVCRVLIELSSHPTQTWDSSISSHI
jgi:hypothetical protein